MEAPPRRSARNSVRRPAAHVAVLAGGLVVAAVLILNEARHLYFFGDDWAFLLVRDLSGDSLLRPHNEHWTAIPLLTYRILFHVLGIDHFLVWAAMPVALHVVICSLLFLLLRRHGVGPWVSVLSVLVLAFLCGNLGEDLLWPFQIGFLGSAALGLAALLVHDRVGTTRRGLAATWALTVLSLMCSGMAIPMAVWLGAMVLLARGLRSALVAVVPPAVVYLAWYVGYGRHATSSAPETTVDQMLDFTFTGLASLWEVVLRVPSTGGLVFVGLLALVLVGRLPERVRVLALSGLLAAMTTYLFISMSRSGYGPAAAEASRYAYFGVLMTLPAFAAAASWAAERLSSRPLERRVVWVVVAGLVAVSGAAQLHTFREGREALDPGLRQRLLAGAELVREDARLISPLLAPTYHPDITVERLSRASVQDALPDDPTTPQGRVDAAVSLQAAAGPRPVGLPAPTRVPRLGLPARRIPEHGCRTLKARPGAFFDLPPSASGSEIAVEVNQPVLQVQMLGGFAQSYVRDLPVVPHQRTYVASSSAVTTLRVNLDPGKVTLCAP